MTSLNAKRRRCTRANILRKPTMDALEQRSYMAAVAGAIDFGATKQTVEGLGAAPIVWTQPAEFGTTSFYDGLINDLGTSGARATIAADFEAENDNADPNVFNWSNFKSDTLKPALGFLQRLNERGAKSFFLTVWSPPYWQKTNHAIKGGGNLRYDMREEFAEFCAAAVIAAERDYGLKISGVSVQNEQFFVEDYESAILDARELRDTVIAVQKKFARENLTTKVIANEDLGDQDSARWSWYTKALLESDEIDRSKLIIGSHSTVSSAMATQAAQLAGTGVPLWYTEVSGQQPDWAGGLNSSLEISDIFTKAGATSYYYYYFDTSPAQSYEYAPYVGTASLLSDGVPNGKYHALKHFYKYVRPGMQRVTSSIDETGGTRLAAFKDPATGNSTVVLTNSSGTSMDYTLNLSNLGKSANYDVIRSTEFDKWVSLGKLTGTGSVTITLPAYSIVTLHDGPEAAAVTGNPGVVLPASEVKDMTSGWSGPEQLRNAAYNGDLNRLNQILAWLPPEWVNIPDSHGWTALHAVAASSYFHWGAANLNGVMQALLAHGADPLAVTDEGFTAVHVAAMNQFLEWGAPASTKSDMIVQLLNAGTPIDAVDLKGRTALHWAALTTASVDQTYYNVSVPLLLADRGASKTVVDQAGRTPYDYAMQEYKAPFVQILGAGVSGFDTLAPFARKAIFNRDKNQIGLTITENVAATFTAGDVQLVNLTTGQPVTGWTMASPVFSTGLTTAYLKFTSRLPDGAYRMTVPAGTFADQNGVLSAVPIVVSFNVLSGDTDGNNVVNFDDLLTLARNYGQSGRTWSQGDFDGNGSVNFDDLLALARKYNTSMPPAATLPAAAASATATEPRVRQRAAAIAI